MNIILPENVELLDCYTHWYFLNCETDERSQYFYSKVEAYNCWLYGCIEWIKI